MKGKQGKSDTGAVAGHAPDHVIETGGQGHGTNAQDHEIANADTEDENPL